MLTRSLQRTAGGAFCSHLSLSGPPPLSFCVGRHDMSVARIMVGVVICLAALLAGCSLGLAMGGFGICAVGFSASLVGSSAVIGALFGGTMALVWRKTWWAGAVAYSAPSLLGVAFGASSGEWQRVVGILICSVASVLAAFVVRYPSPESLKQ